jgi:octopine/nopaline transport system permease protein
LQRKEQKEASGDKKLNFGLVVDTFPKILGATHITLLLAFTAIVLGFSFAVPIALTRLSKMRILSAFAYGYVYMLRSTPLLVQIFLVYYGSGQFKVFFEYIGLWIFFKNAWFCAIFSLSLNSAAYGSEIIRGGIQSVPFGQIEAARSIGMSGLLLFRRIIFPVAIRQALPAYGNELMLIVKSTSLASTITIIEITGTARQIISESYRPMEVFLVAGSIYLLINYLISRAVSFTETRFNRHMLQKTS